MYFWEDTGVWLFSVSPFSHTPPAFGAFILGMLEDSAFCKGLQKTQKALLLLKQTIVNAMSIFLYTVDWIA